MAKKASEPKVPLMVRLPRDLHREVSKAAKAEERSLNAMVIQLLRRGLKSH